MSVGHYENFPVASLLLPAALRRPVSVIYRFARSADDFADEGDMTPEARLELLDGYRAELDRLMGGTPPEAPLFQELREVIQAHALPLAPFYDLLDAFSQDVRKARYASFAEVMDYCRRSADPVGRLMLHLYGKSDGINVAASDSVCSALQLINFWQDVEIDFRKNRIYLPQDEMARFGVTEAQIAARDVSGGWWELMRFQIERARTLMLSGAPLALRLPGRIGLEIRTVVQGGLRILEKLERVRGDVFRRRPVLTAPDDSRRILPAEGGAERLELLLLVPVPAARAPPRDHGALCLLPRGRRRGRRAERRQRRARRAPVVAQRGRAALRGRSAAPCDARACALDRAVPHRRGAAQRDHGRPRDGPEPDPVHRFRRAQGVLPPRRRRRRRARRGNLRLRERADAEV